MANFHETIGGQQLIGRLPCAIQDLNRIANSLEAIASGSKKEVVNENADDFCFGCPLLDETVCNNCPVAIRRQLQLTNDLVAELDVNVKIVPIVDCGTVMFVWKGPEGQGEAQCSIESAYADFKKSKSRFID